jgi:uncharacterized membrane protein
LFFADIQSAFLPYSPKVLSQWDAWESRMWKDLSLLRRAEATLLCALGIWLALVFIAPLSLPAGSVTDLSGSVGSLDNLGVIGQMNPLAATIYLLGDAQCHQLLERSFVINGNQMPFCSRDLGMFIGVVAGMGLAFSGKLKAGWKIALLLLVPMGLDGGAQLISSYESTNLVRLATGILAGIGLAYLLDWFATRMLEPKGAKDDSSKTSDARSKE